MLKVEYRCPKCGSSDVLQDAYFHMNTGEYSTYDNKTCDNCGYDFHTADEVEVEVEDEGEFEYRFYAVSGRVCGDDEDTTLVIKAEDRTSALAEYREQMMAINGLSTSELEHLEANGEGIFINSVVMSTAPIHEV